MAEANQQPAGLPEEPVRVNHTVRNIIIAVVVVALVAVGAFFGVRAFNGSDKTAEKGTEANPVKIGVVGATDPQWVEFKKQAEKQNLYVDIVDFQDYTSENPAVDSGELDLNELPAPTVSGQLQCAEQQGSAADRRRGNLPARCVFHQVQERRRDS